MTNEELISKIKAEIDKLYGEYKDKFHQCGDQYHLGLYDGLDMAKRVLDSLESEKPVPADLEEAAEQYAEGPECTWVGTTALEYAFIAGAKWHRSQMMQEAVEGEVMTNGLYPYEPRIVAPYPNCPYEFGDKVRVIVCKKED